MRAVSDWLLRVARRRFRNTWIHRLPITTWIYRKVVSRRYGGVITEVRFKGYTFQVDPSDITIVPTLISGEYEALQFEVFESLLQPGMTFCDVGANIGIYTVAACKAIGPSGRVFAFEPAPSNVVLLRDNLSLNEVTNATIVSKAVANMNGTAHLYLEPHSMGTHSLEPKSANWIDIETTTLDSFLQGFGIDKIDLMKIDVEGFEAHVIEGARGALQTQPTLLLEFSAQLLRRCGTDPEAFASLLMSFYPRCYVIEERRRALESVSEPSKLSHLFNANLLLCREDVQVQLNDAAL